MLHGRVPAWLESLSSASRWFRWSVYTLALLVSLSLVVTMAPAPTAAADPVETPVVPTDEPAKPATWVEPTGEGLVRPDWLSAAVTARSSGKRVEVLAARTESSRSWLQPSGVVESEATGPVRFKDPEATDTDGWRDIDTSLVPGAGGELAPRAVPGDLKLSGGGSPAQLLTYTDIKGRTVTLGSGLSDAALPKPTVEGSTAVYADVLPGVDIRVQAKPRGFEQLWVITDQAGLDAFTAAHGDGETVGLQGPLTLSKVAASPAKDGSVEFTAKNTDTGKDKVVAELASPTMWDGATDRATGLPENVTSVEFAVSAAGEELSPVDPAETGKLALKVRADQDWLTSPERVFPITIDPTYEENTSAVTFDTYVETGDTTDRSGDGELRLGFDGTNASRSFLNIDTASLAGRTVMSGSLTLWGTYSGSCAASGWSAYTAGLASTSTRWTAQPTIGTKYATSTATKGFDASCAPGEVSIDMKAQLQAWATAGAGSQGLMLRADSETVTAGFKRFESSQGAHPPVLRWTANRAPVKLGTPSVGGAVPYKPAGASTTFLYTANTKPNLSAVASDPDADNVTAEFQVSTATTFATIASSCVSGPTASGGTVSCTLGTALATDGRYYARGRVKDSSNAYGPYSDPLEIRIAAVAPTAPVVTCPSPYTNGAWQTAIPTAPVTCTVTAVGTGYSAPAFIDVAIDAADMYFVRYPITQSSSTSVAKTTVKIPNTSGGHQIRPRAVGPAGLMTYGNHLTGWGSTPLLKRPYPSAPRVTTTDRVQLYAAGKGQTSPAVTAKAQWKVTGSASWQDAPAVAANAQGVTQITGQSITTGWFDTTTVVGVADANGVTVNERLPTLIDLRVCVTLTGGTGCTAQTTVLRMPHAFGNGFPVADAGPGQVALWTGELQVDDSDADLATPGGSLSVSRSHSSFAGTPAVQNAVFGPGWTASFDGDDSGAGGSELLDGTTVDGSLAVISADNDVLVYTTPTGARRTTSVIPTGTYKAADTDTETAGATLTVSGSGASTVAELKSDDGIVTKFQVKAIPTTAPAVFRTVEVRDPAVADKTTYAYDTAGRVTTITAPLPDGVTSCTTTTPVKGCRILKITYASLTTATSTTPGDFQDRVKSISAQVNTDADKVLATYKYEIGGRLVQATDSRTGLTNSYAWTGSGTTLRLAGITPPGQAGFTFAYTSNKLAKVTRPIPTTAGGGTAQLAAYIYGVPTSGTGLPDMPTTTAAWAQTKTPTTGFAVFGPDQVISGITPAAVTNTDWWKRADLQYTDGDGWTINSAGWGAGDWQYTAIDYDSIGNPIREFDERGTRAVLDSQIGAAAADQYATLTTYNDDITDGSGNIITPAGSLVTDTYGPLHEVVADWNLVYAREHAQTVYDEGAPNGGINPATGQPYRLATKATVTAELADGTVVETMTRSFTGYGALETGDTTGWELSTPTSTTVDMDFSGDINAGDITTKTRLDSKGRVIENRQPESNGADAGTRETVYYTGDASASAAACRNKPEYAGMICRVGPKAQPAGQSMPVTTTTAYTWDGQTATEQDDSGSVTSTTTTTFNAQDRPITTTTAVTGLASSTAVPAVTTSYDAATGNVTGTTSTAGSTAMTYDDWGRQLTYTNTPAGQTADSATTTYNGLGQVTSVVDNNGQATYTYDGTDANGQPEYRGLVTAVKVKLTGGTEYTSTGAYDHAGALVTEKLPGQITRWRLIDNAGEQYAYRYNGQISDGYGGTQSDQPWFGWDNRPDALGRTSYEWTTTWTAGPSGTLGQSTISWDRAYVYDPNGRLTRVHDNVGDNPCETRSYGFDRNGNRTSQTVTTGPADGTCPVSGGLTTTRDYDTADRPTTGANSTGAYTYDELGRQLALPAADAPHPDKGAVSLGYYDTDAAKTIEQDGTTTSFVLDGVQRRLGQTTSTGGATTNTLVRHYTDGGDNPTWSVDTTGLTTTTTRYAELINGDLGLTLTNVGSTTTVELALNTPRGDFATTVDLPVGATGPTGTASTGIETWSDYTEYGQPTQGVASTPGSVTGIGYGWLGAKQRATMHAGLVLMGARLYNRSTGSFTSRDPVFGGNTTPYVYPEDPVNNADLSGDRRKNVGPHQAKVCVTWGPVACGTGLGARSWAYKMVKKSGYGGKSSSDRANAVQHASWMAATVYSLVTNYGWSVKRASRFASKLGKAHEKDTKGVEGPGSADSRKDLRNNMHGIAIAQRALRNGWSKKQMGSWIIYKASPMCKRECLRLK